MKRELRLALLLVLLGAALTYVSSSRDWVDAVVQARPPLPPVRREASGADVVDALRPLALLSLAAVAALAATRRLGRVLVGALVLLAGAAVVVVTAVALSEGATEALRNSSDPGAASLVGSAPGFTGWWGLAVAGGLLVAAGGLLVAVRGRAWTTMSSRYEAPAARTDRLPARPEVAAWDALDRGEDPTETGTVLPPRVDG